MGGAFDNFDPTGTKKPVPPTPAPGGAFSNFNPTAAAPPATTTAPKGGAFSNFDPTGANQQQTTNNGAPQPGWGINWRTGDVTMPQPVQDWGNIAGNEASMGLPERMGLPGLKAASDAARQRLGPIASTTADVAGNILSPTTFLNALGGPILAGAAHEGIKSAAAGNDLKTIAEDTTGGAAWGSLGYGAAKLAPKVLPTLTQEGVKMGLGYAAHQALGGWADATLPEGVSTIAPWLSGYGLSHKIGEVAGEQVRKVADLPATKQALQNFILGAGSALRTAGGPWGQWIPGQ